MQLPISSFNSWLIRGYTSNLFSHLYILSDGSSTLSYALGWFFFFATTWLSDDLMPLPTASPKPQGSLLSRTFHLYSWFISIINITLSTWLSFVVVVVNALIAFTWYCVFLQGLHLILLNSLIPQRKGVPGWESRTGSRLLSPSLVQQCSVKKMNPGCKIGTIECLC